MLKKMRFPKPELNAVPCPFPAAAPDGRPSCTSDISQGHPLFMSSPAIRQTSAGEQYKRPLAGSWGNDKGRRAKEEARDDPSTDGR